MWILNPDGTYTIRDSEEEKKLIEIAIAEEKAEKKGERKGERKGRKKVIIAVAKEMLKMNMNIEDISKVTKLSPEQILKLK